MVIDRFDTRQGAVKPMLQKLMDDGSPAMHIFRSLAGLAVASLAIVAAPEFAIRCQTKILTSARPSASVVIGQMTSILNQGPDAVNVPGQRLARKEASVLVGNPGKRITIRLAGGKSARVEICNY